jgi:hypothetical protein
MICSGEEDQGGNGDGSGDKRERFCSSGRHDGWESCNGEISRKLLIRLLGFRGGFTKLAKKGLAPTKVNAASRESTSRRSRKQLF